MSIRCHQVVRIFDNEATGRREYFVRAGQNYAEVLATSFSRSHVEHRSSIPWGFYRKAGPPTWPKAAA